jgi:ABC-type multidrug transport system fused ATPase/permease subunit
MSFPTIKKLFALCRQEVKLLLAGLLFLIISSICLLLYPQTIKVIIDESLTHKDMDQLNFAALIALVVFAIQAISSSLRYYYFTIAGEKTVMRLRKTLFKKILEQDMFYFDQQKTGELLSRLTSDTAILQNTLSVNISMLIRSSAQALGCLIMLFMTSAKLTFFILLIIPPIGIIAALFGKKVKAISRQTQDVLANATAIAEEGITGIRTLKAFASESFEQLRYNLILEKYFNFSKNKIFEIAKFTTLVSSLGLATVVFVVWYGGTQVISSHLTVGTLTSFLLYLMTLAFSVAMLGSLWTDFMSAIGSSGRIFQLLDLSPSIVNTKNHLKLTENSSISFNQVHFHYPSRPDVEVLKGINFSILPNETVAFVGSSGSGKSTIISLLMRFYEIKSGQILIGSSAIEDYELLDLRSNIGLVAQEPMLISETILENIRYGKLDATFEEIQNAAKLAYAHDFILKFPDGYHTLVGQRGVQLSGGQKQRVAIARALIKNPKILILDEATSALDSESEYLVQQAIDNLMGKRTTIIVAHRLSTIKKADKIFVMNQGKIVQSGTHANLLTDESGIYKKLIEKQFEI